MIYAFELLLSVLITSGFPFSYQIRFTMAPHSTPTDKRAIADSLFAVKEQLPDGHYLALMNMLGGKQSVPDITNAKLVEIRWDHFRVQPMGDELECDWFPYRKTFQVLDGDRLAALAARDPDYAARSVAYAREVGHCFTMMHPMVSSITTDLLSIVHEALVSNNGGYSKYAGGVIRVHGIEVLATYD